MGNVNVTTYHRVFCLHHCFYTGLEMGLILRGRYNFLYLKPTYLFCNINMQDTIKGASSCFWNVVEYSMKRHGLSIVGIHTQQIYNISI